MLLLCWGKFQDARVTRAAGLKGLLIWGVILTVIAYGTFKGLTWYQVSRFMLKVKSAAESHMAIQHGWIDSSVSGEIVIHDLEISPFQLRKSLQIDKLTVRFDSLLGMLSSFPLFEKSENFNIPQSLELQWQDVVLPLSKNWSAYLPFTDLQRDLFGLACGKTSSIGVGELLNMGYSDITHSAKLSYDFDPASRALQVKVDADFAGIGHHIGELNLRLAHGWQWPPAADAMAPALTGLYLAFDDKSIMRRLTLLCGKQGGYNQQEFIAATVTKTQQRLASIGISISAPLQNAYSTFLQGDGILEVIFEPAGAIDVMDLALQSPAEIEQRLNYSVKVNRVVIPDGTFKINGDRLLSYLFPSAQPPQTVQQVAATPPPEYSYYPLRVEQLDHVVDNKIKLMQVSGQVVEGMLKAVENNRIDVNIPQQQGMALLHFDKIDIDNAWVWLTKQPVFPAPVETVETAKTNAADKNSTTTNSQLKPVQATAEPTNPATEQPHKNLSEVLEKLNDKNTTIVYEEGADIDTPLAEGEYFEIIEVEPAPQFSNPTINDRPAAKTDQE